MSAATQDRATNRKDTDLYSYPVAADAVIYLGTFVGRDASGYAEPADAGSNSILGVSTRAQVDNTGGANGDLQVEVRDGRFYFDNSSTDAVTQANVGQQAVIEDDQTVAEPGGAGPVAGVIEAVDANGVWIDTRRRSPEADPA